MRKILSRNPFTGKVIQEFDFITSPQLQIAIQQSRQGFQINRKRRIQERASMIGQLGEVIDKNARKVAETITLQMGKPIAQAEGEVAKTVSFCKHFAQNFNDILPNQIKTDAKKTLVKYDPLGTVYNIVPFNFPFFLNFKGGLSNLLLGNSLLVRNADSTPLIAKLTEELVRKAGFDSGEYQNVYTSHDHLDMILSSQQVMGVCFTGSSKSGSIIAEKAGKYLKKSVMELGGNDPFVVLLDADVQKAINDAYQFRCLNAGQICFSPKRFIIVREHYEKFKSLIIEKFEKIKYGDPMNSETQIGPLAREDLHTNLSSQLNNIPSSWKITWQRKDVKNPFFPITVIEASDTQFFDEELFGPVFTFFKANDQRHAIQIANRGTYGLAASVYSQSRGQQVIQQIRSGMCFINSPSKSMVNFPTGGVGRSGYGRECGTQGMKEFANVRVYYSN